jgi:hypothetical protein
VITREVFLYVIFLSWVVSLLVPAWTMPTPPDALEDPPGHDHALRPDEFDSMARGLDVW